MIQHRATVRAGRVVVADDARFRRELARLEGREVDVVVKVHREASSDPQRRYWFGVVIAELAEHLGYFKDECHDAVMWRFTRYTDEHGIDRRRHYRDLTTAEAERLHEDVRMWAAAEMGVVIAEPNEVPDFEPVWN